MSQLFALVLGNKRVVAIVGLVFVVLAQLAYTNHLSGKLRAAQHVADLRVQAHVDAFTKVVQKQQAAANKSAAYYEKWRAEHQQKSGVIRHEVVKIVSRPVYRHVCFDDDGVSAVNAAIGSVDGAK